ncbi:glycoside hydrolase family 2 TIM barrel-domain containing protein, partial [Staphylococcus warneri]|uniref:glycoside hydrolase family 2 TIM barrel-domain containing protein n=1 Tax=Staphylococcus warneri TaxID=1292 RepID=UPI003703B43B
MHTHQPHQQLIQHFIPTHNNHPSLLMSSIPNHPPSNQPPAKPYFHPFLNLPPQKHPQHPPLTILTILTPQPHLSQLQHLLHLLSLNTYYPSYTQSPHLQTPKQSLHNHFPQWSIPQPNNPIIFTHYRPDTLPRLHAIDDQMFTE